MKSIRKIAHTCDGCGMMLTLEERAFNETLCHECQRDANQIFTAFILPMMSNVDPDVQECDATKPNSNS